MMFERIFWGLFFLVSGFLLLVIVGDWFARGNIYSDENAARKMQVCLSQQVKFEDCYSVIYQYNKFKK